MKKILFLCHGHICRSPMAEFVMKELLRQSGREREFVVDSAAVTTEEIGNPIYPPAKRKLHEHHIPFDDHRAHKVTPAEFDTYDLVVIMDESNRRILSRIVGHEKMDKVRLMMEFAGSNRDVDDPWYSGDFEQAYRDILAGCKGILNEAF